MMKGTGLEGDERERGALKKGYHYIEMNTRYPFGELRQLPTQPASVFVRRKLPYSCRAEEAALIKTASLLQRARHQNLINLLHIQREPKALHFCYEYAPLAIERWLIHLGQDLVDRLKKEMLGLSLFLNQKRVGFEFSPLNLGLSHQMGLQYFLGECWAEEGQEEGRVRNHLLNRQKIDRFFQALRDNEEECPLATMYSSSVPVQRKDPELSMFNSVATRESWEESPSKWRVRAKGGSRSRLSEKLEQSKAKTSEILVRLKKIRNLQF